jgi:DNA repair protein RecO (recombination protein O)
MKQKDTGILLQRRSYSENSWLLTFYLKGAGRKNLLFKGGKKKVQGLHPLGVYDCLFYHRPESQLGLLNNLENNHPFHRLNAEPERILCGFFVSDVLRQCLKEEVGEARVFEQLFREIEELENTGDLYSYPLLFLVRLTDLLGYSPISESETPNFFDTQKGEFVYLQGLPNEEMAFEVVNLLHRLFQGETHLPSDRPKVRLALQQMLLYWQQHIPNFNVDKTLEVLKDTLYR